MKLFCSKSNKHYLQIAIKKPFSQKIVDASAIGVGTVLVQTDDKGQLQDISYNWRFFTFEQKIAKIYRDLTAIVYAFEIYNCLTIGSKHPITILRDH